MFMCRGVAKLCDFLAVYASVVGLLAVSSMLVGQQNVVGCSRRAGCSQRRLIGYFLTLGQQNYYVFGRL